MTEQEKHDLCAKVEYEGGMEYTFVHYSSFGEIEDKKFHELREAFLRAHKLLKKYIGLDSYEEEE